MRRAILSLLIFSAVLSAQTVPVTFVSADPVVTVPGTDGGYPEAGPYTLNVNGTLLPSQIYNGVHSGFDGAGYEILSDVNRKNQEFIVATPEPATDVLLGSGLLLAGALRFSRRKKTKTIST